MDRLFPSCFLALVEFVARATFGLPDIKKCWFGNTFVYRSSGGSDGFSATSHNAPGILGVASGTTSRAIERLARFYGICVSVQTVASSEALLDCLTGALNAGVIAITCFDRALFPGGSGPAAPVDPGKVAVVGYEPISRRLRLVDPLRGRLEIECADLGRAFERLRDHGVAFAVSQCTRRVGEASLPFDRAAIMAELSNSLENIWSRNPSLGLNALQRFHSDVAAAVAPQACSWPLGHLGLFARDRHCLRMTLPYWLEAIPSMEVSLVALDMALGACFGRWASVEASAADLFGRGAAPTSEFTSQLNDVIRAEYELAGQLQRIFSDLREGLL